MSSENIGKIRPKRNQSENKPYTRNTVRCVFIDELPCLLYSSRIYLLGSNFKKNKKTSVSIGD